MENGKYWYEVAVQPSKYDFYGKALNCLRLLSHSLIIKNPGPLRASMSGEDRYDLYFLLRKHARDMKQEYEKNSWEYEFSTLLQKIAKELVAEEKFSSEESFFSSLILAMQAPAKAPEALMFFNIKVQKLYEAYRTSGSGCA